MQNDAPIPSPFHVFFVFGLDPNKLMKRLSAVVGKEYTVRQASFPKAIQ